MTKFSLQSKAMRATPGDRTGPSRRGVKFATILVILATLTLPSTASAEGGWDSHLNGTLSGFNSRQFWDGQIDNADSKIFMGGCSRRDAANHRYRAELKRSKFGPDQKFGQWNFDACHRGNFVGNEGNLGNRGNYYITYTHHNFGRIDVNWVAARY